MAVHVSALTGRELNAALPEVARLRIEVFRAYPYLYDGTLEYEEKYLTALTQSKDSIVVAAQDDGRVIGCSTGAALAGHHGEFAEPFLARGMNISEIFYCSESVLSPDYRGQGLGHAFFDRREAHAKRLGYRICTFSSVVRPSGHPLKPSNYRPLDEFWTKRGYRKADGLTASFRWKDIDRPGETDHLMQFWLRELN